MVFLGDAPPVQIRSRTEAQVANAALPCGAELISTRRVGRFVNALFRLTNRPGRGGARGCGSGTGETARTNFLIGNGRIVEWLRAPDQPGDNGTTLRRAPARAAHRPDPAGHDAHVAEHDPRGRARARLTQRTDAALHRPAACRRGRAITLWGCPRLLIPT